MSEKHDYRILIQNDTSPQTQAVSIHHTLGTGVGFCGDGDEHLGKGKTETRNLKIDGSVRGVERRMHPVSRGEEKILICH